MNTQHNLYIGADNKTKHLDKEGILFVCNGFFESFTYQEGIGLWNCNAEPCAIVTVICDRLISERIYDLARDLKGYLHQEAILVTSFPVTAKLI